MITNSPTGVLMRNSVVTLVGLSVIGWGLIFWSVANMSSPVIALIMPMNYQWTFKEIVAVWLMWAVMMGAMMLPSAIPMILIHRRVAAKRRSEERRVGKECW